MDYKKKTQKPNFSELYKEKMEKMRVPGKIDLKGSQTKTDSTKASEAIQSEPVLWGLTKNTSTTLNEAHFKDALDRMKESGVSVRGKECEPSVDRIIKTITEEESSEGSISDVYASSKDSDDSDDPELLEKEKIAARKLLKELENKKERPLRELKPSDFRKPYLSWLEKERSALRVESHTTTDGMATRKNRNNKKYSEILDILSSESDPSDGSTVSSDVVTDPDDPFSHTKEGKEIMRKMKKIKPERKHRRAEYELKRKMKELRMDGPGLRPSVDSLRAASRGPVEWCDLARAQAESREQKGWIGHDEVKDIDSMWLRDIREASEIERKSTLGGDGFNE